MGRRSPTAVAEINVVPVDFVLPIRNPRSQPRLKSAQDRWTDEPISRRVGMAGARNFFVICNLNSKQGSPQIPGSISALKNNDGNLDV